MTLKQLGRDKNLLIGVAVAMDPFKSDQKYKDLIAQEFNLITPENAMKWGPMSQGRGKYDFSDADLLVDFAKQNNQQIHGHVLVWDNQLPDWLTQGNFSKTELQDILEEHIHAVLNHFKGKVQAWDVVNEALEDESGELEQHFWYKNLGPEYIEFAFKVAREADPNVKLFYNEWGAEDLGEKSEGQYKLITDLLNRNIPIDAVGMQMHTGLGFNPKPQDVVKNIQRYTDLGLSVYITEMDVRLEYGKGTKEENEKDQAKIYKEIIEAITSDTKTEAITFWGLDDAHSWIPYFLDPNDTPLLFDRDLNPKLAYQEVIKALQLK